MKLALSGLLLVLFIPFAFAEPNATVFLNGSNSLSVALPFGEARNFSFLINNTGDVVIYNVSMTNFSDSSFSRIDVLDVNASGFINLNITPSSVYSLRNFVSVLRFEVQAAIDDDLKVVSVGLNSSGFFPSNITVNQNDSVNITNLDAVNLSVKNVDLSFDYDLQPNESKVLSFADISEFEVYVYDEDNSPLFVAQINVINRTKMYFVHSSSFDKPFSFNVESTLPSSVLGINVFTPSFTLAYDEEGVGALQVVNLGANDLLNVRAGGDWIGVTNSSVPLLRAGQNFISFFTVKPKGITETSQTGTNYSKAIVVNASNAVSVSSNVQVFVRLANLTNASQSNQTKFVFLLDTDAIEAFCRQNPSRCPQNNVTTIQIQERVFRPDLNESDVVSLIDELPKTVERIGNAAKTATEEAKTKATESASAITSFRDEVRAWMQQQEETTKNLSATVIEDNNFFRAGLSVSERSRVSDSGSFLFWSVLLFVVIIAFASVGLIIMLVVKSNNAKLRRGWM